MVWQDTGIRSLVGGRFPAWGQSYARSSADRSADDRDQGQRRQAVDREEQGDAVVPVLAERRGPVAAQAGDEVEVEMLRVDPGAEPVDVAEVKQRAEQPGGEQQEKPDRQPDPERDAEDPAVD